MARPAALLLAILALPLLSACPRAKEKWNREEAVSREADGTGVEGFLVRDETRPGRRPGVLVAHDWWGPDEYARRRARMLADEGYVAFAMDLYGNGRTTREPAEAMKMATEAMADPSVPVARVRAALGWLKAQPACDPDRIAAIGFGFGGTVLLHAARAGLPLAGVVAFHSGLRFVPGFPEAPITARILVCHGAEDIFVPVDEVAGFRAAMTAAGADFRILEYQGAQHSFTVPESDLVSFRHRFPVKYNSAADRRSWQDMKAFLAEVLR